LESPSRLSLKAPFTLAFTARALDANTLSLILDVLATGQRCLQGYPNKAH